MACYPHHRYLWAAGITTFYIPTYGMDSLGRSSLIQHSRQQPSPFTSLDTVHLPICGLLLAR